MLVERKRKQENRGRGMQRFGKVVDFKASTRKEELERILKSKDLIF